MNQMAVKIFAACLVLAGLVLGVLALTLARKPAAPRVPATVANAEPAKTVKENLHAVVLAAKNIAAGQAITPDLLQVSEWPATPASGFSTAEQLAGQTARLDIATGEPVLQTMLATGLATHLKAGERAVTIPVDEISGAARRMQPGDLIDVFFTMNKGNEIGVSQARLLLSRVRLLAYGHDSLDGPDPGTASSSGTRRDAATVPRTAMLAVPLPDVNELLLASHSGKLLLALRSPTDEQIPDTALFAPLDPVLKGRPDLTAEQRKELGQAENLAYAGTSLPQLSAADTAQAPAARRPAQPKNPRFTRTVEVIRAGKAETLNY